MVKKLRAYLRRRRTRTLLRRLESSRRKLHHYSQCGLLGTWEGTTHQINVELIRRELIVLKQKHLNEKHSEEMDSNV